MRKTTSKKNRGMPKEVAARFASYPSALRPKLQRLRRVILDTAARTHGVDGVEEGLRWGQPAYLSKSGSTIRIDAIKDDPSRYAMYFICHSGLVGRFRELYPQLAFEGNRAILFDARQAMPESEMRHCIALALTYHTRKS